MIAFWRLLSVVVVALGTQSLAISIEPGSTRTEGRTAPNGISTLQPSFSWRLESAIRNDVQSAYQVQVASTKDLLLSEHPDLWDSRKVASSDVAVAYSGLSLRSKATYWWRVRAYDGSGVESLWSDAATFEMGLLSSSDWQAKWIANQNYRTGSNSLPLFAKSFTVTCAVASARLYMIGLGLHSAQINGHDAGTAILAPAYNTFSKTLTYDTCNVTGLIKQGENVIGVELGKGAYDAEASPGRYMKWTTAPAELKLLAQLEYQCADGTEGTVLSDDTWQSTLTGPRLEASWFGGEEYNATKEIEGWSSPSGDRSRWETVNVTTSPGGKLTGPFGPGMAVVEKFDAVSVKAVGSSHVFDFGVNFAGKYTFSIRSCPAGRRLVFWPSEIVNAEGLADQSTTGEPIFDGYTCSGKPSETFSPKFVYHGMRYLQVDNLAASPDVADMTGQVIRQNNEVAGTVETSSELFNGIHKIIDRSIQSNSYSVLTDCPHREKLGWLEQTHLVFDAVTHGYDIQAWGRDIVRTIVDAQDPSGLIPDIAPEFVVFDGGFRDDPNWGSAGIMLPLKLYTSYGDMQLLSDNYAAMQRYVEYLTSKSGGSYLLDYGLGDWVTFDPCTPTGVTATFGYQQVVNAMITIAAAIGNADDAAKYTQLQASIRQAFHAKYFDTASNASYSCGSQAANAIALDMGAVPSPYQKAVANSLVGSLQANGNHLTVGEIALPSLFRALQGAGRDDVIFDMMSLTTNVSYGYQLVNGATSLWEKWDGYTGGGSLNHFMLGYSDTWIAGLSGLQQDASSVSWQRINFIPKVVGDLTYAKSSYQTPNGVASASWALQQSSLVYDVVVPVGSTAKVVLTGSDIREGGQDLAGRPGILSHTANGLQNTVIVGAGTYNFTVSRASI